MKANPSELFGFRFLQAPWQRFPPMTEWPANVRELPNRTQRTLSIFSRQTITPDELGLEQRKKYQRPCR